MAQTIRGLTVEISADASQFNKQMNAVRKDSKTTQAELEALQKSLQLEFDEKKLTQAQKKVQEAIDVTAERADILRERLKFLEESGNVNTSHYRKIQSELAQCELEGQKLQKRLENINNVKLDNFSKHLDDTSKKIGAVGKALTPISAGAAAALTGLGAFGIKAASTGANIDDLSLRFGVSAERIQEWQYLAVQTGVDVEVFNKSLIKARAAMLDLATGTENNASKAMKNLGLSIDQFANNEEMFDGVISALASMEDKTLQAAYANEIFGDKIATQMLPFLNAGAEEIAKFKDEFASIGALSNEQVAALAKLDDAIFRLKESFKNVALQIGAAFQPLLEKLANYIQDNVIPKLQKLAEWFNNLSLSQQEMIAKTLLFVAALAPVVMGIGKVTSAMGNLIKTFPQLGAALKNLATNPIVQVIGIVLAIIAVLYTQCEEFRESINKLVSTLFSALQPIMSNIMAMLSTLMEALMPIIEVVGQILALLINNIIVALMPIIEIISSLFELLMPLIQLALIPLQAVFTALQIPLQILGQLLEWLSPLFQIFANITKGAFDIVLKVINVVLSAVEKAVNFVIDIINGLIDTYNFLFGWLFGKASQLGHVSLQIKTQEDKDVNVNTKQNTTDSPYDSYEKIGAGAVTSSTNSTTYNEDNSQYNIEIQLNATGNLDYDTKTLADEVIKQIVTKKQAMGR